MSAGFFRGTSVSQDARFSDKQRSLLRQLHVRFPAVYREPLDLERVQLPVLSPWIHATVAAVLGFEDDVVGSLVVNTLQQHKERRQRVDPRELQLTLTGFLEQAAPAFVESLWRLMLSAANEKSGIPRQLIESAVSDLQQRQQSSPSTPRGGTGGSVHSSQPSAPAVGSVAVGSSSDSVSASNTARVPVPASIPVPASAPAPAPSPPTASSPSHRRARSRFGPPLTRPAAHPPAHTATATAAPVSSASTARHRRSQQQQREAVADEALRSAADEDSASPAVKKARVAR